MANRLLALRSSAEDGWALIILSICFAIRYSPVIYRYRCAQIIPAKPDISKQILVDQIRNLSAVRYILSAIRCTLSAIPKPRSSLPPRQPPHLPAIFFYPKYPVVESGSYALYQMVQPRVTGHERRVTLSDSCILFPPLPSLISTYLSQHHPNPSNYFSI